MKNTKFFWVDFSGSVLIEANTKEEAEGKFWQDPPNAEYLKMNNVEEVEES